MAISLHEDMFAITGKIKNRTANIYVGGIGRISSERMEEKKNELSQAANNMEMWEVTHTK